MNFLDHVITAISPAAGFNRLQKRLQIQAYEAVKPGRQRRKRGDAKSGNAKAMLATKGMRETARYLERNNDIAGGIIDTLNANIVGSGIAPEPQVQTKKGEPATDVNETLTRLWEDWIEAPEVTGEFDYYSLQSLIAQGWIRDGEMLVREHIGPVSGLKHATKVPFSLEALEADFLPISQTDASKNLSQGVIRDQWGRPITYMLATQHPGDAMGGVDLIPVSADRVQHIKSTNRLHQVRGVSMLHSVILRLDDIAEIDETERVASRIAAAMAIFIKRDNTDTFDPNETTGADGFREMEWVPGMVFDQLRAGESIGTINPERPNNALIPFRDAQLRSAASGTRTGYSSISKNYNGTFSAQRQELVEQFVHYRVLWNYFANKHVRRTWKRFVMAAQLARLLKLNGVDLDTIFDCSLSQPVMPWIDPQKEMTANAMAIDKHIKSESEIIRASGRNPQRVRRQIKQDNDDKSKLGISEVQNASNQGAGK